MRPNSFNYLTTNTLCALLYNTQLIDHQDVTALLCFCVGWYCKKRKKPPTSLDASGFGKL